MTLRVAVVSGGPSAEAEVSRSSARGVCAALERAGHQPLLLELTSQLPAALQHAVDVVFPVTHGAVGEDGCLQGMLEVLALPYVGSGVLASALAASKPHAKVLFRAAGLPVADGFALAQDEHLQQRVTEARRLLTGSLVVKPASGGSAIGVEILPAECSAEELRGAVERVFRLDESVLVERFITGVEVTCGVLEADEGLLALPPTLIRPRAAEHYDFISKYQPGGSEHVCPAPLPFELLERIRVAALAAHVALGCRDLSRIDFLVEASGPGSFVVLEANTLPGMTPMSLFPEAAAIAGIPFEALCDRLVRRAVARPRREAPQAFAMP